MAEQPLNTIVGQMVSRYNTPRIIIQVGENSYHIVGRSAFGRTAKDENGNLTMFDFEGGPCITIDTPIKVNGKIMAVASITQDIVPSPEDNEPNTAIVGITLKEIPTPEKKNKKSVPSEEISKGLTANEN